MSRDVVVLVTGGVDSTVLAYSLATDGRTVLPVHIDYGQVTAATELLAIKRALPTPMAASLQRLSITGLWDSPDPLFRAVDLWRDMISATQLIIPNRSAVLMTFGFAYASRHGIPSVAAGFISANEARDVDATASYLDGLAALAQGSWRVDLELPLVAFSKREVVAVGLELGVPLWLTYSCPVNPTVHCGACPNCRDRIDAFAEIARDG